MNPPTTVDCGAASSTGGPTNARYSLVADQQTLDKAFDESVAANSELVQRPGSGVDSPPTWHSTETKDADLVLGDAQRQNLEDLHNWWLKYG